MEWLIESKNDLEELKQDQKDSEPEIWKLEAVFELNNREGFGCG